VFWQLQPLDEKSAIPEVSAQDELLSDDHPFFDALEQARSWGNSQMPASWPGEPV
jgi:hypothetical protein